MRLCCILKALPLRIFLPFPVCIYFSCSTALNSEQSVFHVYTFQMLSQFYHSLTLPCFIIFNLNPLIHKIRTLKAKCVLKSLFVLLLFNDVHDMLFIITIFKCKTIRGAKEMKFCSYSTTMPSSGHLPSSSCLRGEKPPGTHISLGITKWFVLEGTLKII